MTGPINPHNKIHDPGKPEHKEIYSRVLHELKMSVEAAAGDIIVDNIPNYRAILQSIKSAKSLEGRVTISTSSSKKATTKATTHADLVGAKTAFRNSRFLDLATNMKRKAPFSAGG